MANTKQSTSNGKSTASSRASIKRVKLKGSIKGVSPVEKLGHVNLQCIAVDTVNAARAIGVSESMMRKMKSQGTGPKPSMVGKKVVYLVSELKRFLQENLVGGGSK